MEIVMKRLQDLHPYEKNPRKNDAAVDFVANSIKEFGFKVPIVIDKDGAIVCGHTRYKAAKKLQLAEVPCICADDLTDAQIKAYRLADNKVGEASEFIAAEQMGRRAIVMEKDPKYVDVIIKRWEEMTGKKAELIR